MFQRGVPTWLLLILAPAGLMLVAVPGLWVLVSVTAKPLYSDAKDVPSVLHSAPLPRWAGAVEQGRQMVRTSVSEQNLPGVSVAAGVEGNLVWAEGFGYADIRTSIPVTPNHRFRIGTASTVFTSAAAGLLLENGRIRLDEEVQSLVPAFPRKQWPVRLHEVMGHAAGIVGEDDGGEQLFTKHCGQPAEALPYFAAKPLLFQPGTGYRYSSYGWVLVSTVIEAAAKQPFATFLRERVFEPLEMRDTFADPSQSETGEDFPLANLFRELICDAAATQERTPESAAAPVQDRVTPYFPRFASDPKYGLHLMRPLDYSCYAGAGVFASTPSDLVRFGMAMQGGQLLQPATVALVQAPPRPASSEETGYGLGWYRKTVVLAGKQTHVIGQDGDSLGGRVASLLTFPEYGLAVAVTSNVSYSDTAAIGMKVAEAFVKNPQRAPVFR